MIRYHLLASLIFLTQFHPITANRYNCLRSSMKTAAPIVEDIKILQGKDALNLVQSDLSIITQTLQTLGVDLKNLESKIRPDQQIPYNNACNFLNTMNTLAQSGFALRNVIPAFNHWVALTSLEFDGHTVIDKTQADLSFAYQIDDQQTISRLQPVVDGFYADLDTMIHSGFFPTIPDEYIRDPTLNAGNQLQGKLNDLNNQFASARDQFVIDILNNFQSINLLNP